MAYTVVRRRGAAFDCNVSDHHTLAKVVTDVVRYIGPLRAKVFLFTHEDYPQARGLAVDTEPEVGWDRVVANTIGWFEPHELREVLIIYGRMLP